MTEKPSNEYPALNPDAPDFDAIFQELQDWEIQLQDVDFDAVEQAAVKASDKDEIPAISSSKRGGPTPC